MFNLPQGESAIYKNLHDPSYVMQCIIYIKYKYKKPQQRILLLMYLIQQPLNPHAANQWNGEQII